MKTPTYNKIRTKPPSSFQLPPSSFFKFLLPLLLVVSCTPYNEILYLNEGETPDTTTIYQPVDEIYRLKTGDILYIRVHTGNDEIDQKFSLWSGENRMMSSGSSLTGGSSLYLMGYEVDEAGFIDLPVVGYVDVNDKTIAEAKKQIKELIHQYLEDALVIVKLNSIRFTILGEINGPGVQQAFVHKLSIFDAISMAGDVSLDGKKYNVTVLRRTKEGIKRLKLDLTDIDVLNKEGYYIYNDDVIYIEPRKLVALRATTRDVLLIIGSVSSTITAIFVLATLGLK